MEAIYDDVPQPLGFMMFAPVIPARGKMFGAAERAVGKASGDAVIAENELYGGRG
jgi:hypothetical protein